MFILQHSGAVYTLSFIRINFIRINFIRILRFKISAKFKNNDRLKPHQDFKVILFSNTNTSFRLVFP